ncbi:hypothetical protein LTS09_009412 [Friedmanniomyces endolithicus]|nr:hypothetical protein LTS09_009412 [Friedmanniomyces endolithicus]
MAAPSSPRLTAVQKSERSEQSGLPTDRQLMKLKDSMLRNPQQPAISPDAHRLLMKQIAAAERRIAVAANRAATGARTVGRWGRWWRCSRR